MMPSKVLFTGFEKAFPGDTSSTSILLEKLEGKNRFLFTNDFGSIEEEAKSIIQGNWDKVIMFGQKPILKRLCIERQASLDNDILYSDWDLESLGESLTLSGIDFKYSNNPGNYYCNYAYYQMLALSKKVSPKTSVVFIHIPYIDNFRQFEKVVEFFKNY